MIHSMNIIYFTTIIFISQQSFTLLVQKMFLLLIDIFGYVVTMIEEKLFYFILLKA